jgi:hypothetical protein
MAVEYITTCRVKKLFAMHGFPADIAAMCFSFG